MVLPLSVITECDVEKMKKNISKNQKENVECLTNSWVVTVKKFILVIESHICLDILRRKVTSSTYFVRPSDC